MVFGRTKKRTQDEAIATVFFRFSHRNAYDEILDNVEQIKIIDEIVKLIKD